MKDSRTVIRESLAKLADDLDQFEHTTHGCGGPFTVEAIGTALAEAYKRSDSFTISELSQQIRGFLKTGIRPGFKEDVVKVLGDHHETLKRLND